MCGIAGYWHIDNKDAEPEKLSQMVSILKHRGPDDAGKWLSGPVALGHSRLSIIDLKSGHQPMSNEDGSIWIVFNGEIYNFKELRRDLQHKGHQFKTLSDTEVIIHSYEEYGTACVNNLRGMFAFAIWDEKIKRLFIARDRLGIKPLYYYSKDTFFTFASELKALLVLPEIERKISEGAIDDYLTFGYIPQPKTIFKNIRKLSPGMFLVRNEDDYTMSRYWKPGFSNDGYGNTEEYIRELEERLSESVSLRMISDVPLGAFLSGGMDSSTIVALMNRISGNGVKTFSIGFKERVYDETPYAKLVARKYGLDHHSFIVEPESLDILPKIVWQLDEPFSDPSVLPTYFVSKMAREYVKVCLSGDGGDEVFGGYNKYIRLLRYRYWDLLPISIRRTFIGPLYEKWPEKEYGKGMLERALAERNDRTLLLLGITPENKKRTLYKDCFYHQIRQMEGTDSPVTLPLFSRNEDYLSQMQLFDMQYYLPGDILEKVDKMSMLNSLEVRIPILDHHVVEFMGKIPSSVKTTNLNTKILFKKMAKKLLPKEIIKRKKQGFGVPLKYWFKENLDEFVSDILLDEQCLKRGIFKRRSIEDYITNQKTGSRDFGLKIWRLLILELWFREYYDNYSFA